MASRMRTRIHRVSSRKAFWLVPMIRDRGVSSSLRYPTIYLAAEHLSSQPRLVRAMNSLGSRRARSYYPLICAELWRGQSTSHIQRSSDRVNKRPPLSLEEDASQGSEAVRHSRLPQ